MIHLGTGAQSTLRGEGGLLLYNVIQLQYVHVPSIFSKIPGESNVFRTSLYIYSLLSQ